MSDNPSEAKVAEAISQFRRAGLGHLGDTVQQLALQRDRLQAELAVAKLTEKKLRAALELSNGGQPIDMDLWQMLKSECDKLQAENERLRRLLKNEGYNDYDIATELAALERSTDDAQD